MIVRHRPTIVLASIAKKLVTSLVTARKLVAAIKHGEATIVTMATRTVEVHEAEAIRAHASTAALLAISLVIVHLPTIKALATTAINQATLLVIALLLARIKSESKT